MSAGQTSVVDRLVAVANPIDSSALAHAADEPTARAALAAILATELPAHGKRARPSPRLRPIAALVAAGLAAVVVAAAVAGLSPERIVLGLVSGDEAALSGGSDAARRMFSEADTERLAGDPQKVADVRAPTAFDRGRWTGWTAYEAWVAPTTDGGYCIATTTRATTTVSTVPGLFDCVRGPVDGLTARFGQLLVVTGEDDVHTYGAWLAGSAPSLVETVVLRFEDGTTKRVRLAPTRFDGWTPFITFVRPAHLVAGHRPADVTAFDERGRAIASYRFDCLVDGCTIPRFALHEPGGGAATPH